MVGGKDCPSFTLSSILFAVNLSYDKPLTDVHSLVVAVLPSYVCCVFVPLSKFLQSFI